LKRKSGFFLKKMYFQLVLRREKIPYSQMVPCPGKKAFGSPKKAVTPPFRDADFRRFIPGIPFPPLPFTETKRGELGRFLPALFVFGACFLARATRRRI
jgi:hypothetical protein